MKVRQKWRTQIILTSPDWPLPEAELLAMLIRLAGLTDKQVRIPQLLKIEIKETEQEIVLSFPSTGPLDGQQQRELRDLRAWLEELEDPASEPRPVRVLQLHPF